MSASVTIKGSKNGITLVLSETEEYDVLKEKFMYGKRVMGTIRTTYLIDEEGIIIKALSDVKADKNPNEMLEALD